MKAFEGKYHFTGSLEISRLKAEVRVCQADTLIQNSNNTQLYNQNSDAINNPIKYTDLNEWKRLILNQMHDQAQRVSLSMNDFNRRMQEEFRVKKTIIKFQTLHSGKGGSYMKKYGLWILKVKNF